MAKIIQDPDILLSPEATYLTAAFDAKPWDRPEAFYAIQYMAPTLPHLKGVLVTFFEGALETWGRFYDEYKEGGKIANATPDRQQEAWMPTTNDINEGALGSYWVAVQCYPSISEHQLNAWTCYKCNSTSKYMKDSMNDKERRHLHNQARKIDGQNLKKSRHREQASYDKAVVERKCRQDIVKQQKKDAAVAKIAVVKLILDTAKLMQGRLMNTNLDAQLDWHRQFSKEIPKKKDMLTKALKTKALQHAITNYLGRQDPAAASFAAAQEPEIDMEDEGSEYEQ